MAKKALLDVLEQTIGKYVKNLDAESLNVAVWSGKIELHSLELDVDAVNSELDRQAAEAPNLALPFKVVSGAFDTFQVDVPWAQLMSRSVVLRAQGLKIIVEPYDRLSHADHLQAIVSSEPKRAAKIREARVQSVESSDNYRLQGNSMKKLALADENADNKSSSSFGSRLVRRIIENLQIEITDVHISLKDVEGSAGVVLESLSLVTTDVLGKRTFVDRTAAGGTLENSFLYKVLQIKGFGIYLDSETSYSKLRPINEDRKEQEEFGDSQHSYVLSPLSFEARLRQADSNACIDYAKYLLTSELSALSILLSRSQLDLARRISRAVSPSGNTARPLFPEYRPLTRVTKGTAVDWWKYAFRCIGRLNGRRSWVEFYLAFQMRKKYIPLYKRRAHHISCPWLKPLNPKEVEELVALEQTRSISVEGIMAWRNIADAQMEKEREKHHSSRPKAQPSLFSSIFGSTTKAESKPAPEDEPPINLSVEELKQLEALSKEDFLDDDLSNDSKLCDVKFVLGSLNINLISYDLRPIAALGMGVVSANLNASADGAFGFEFKLSDLEINDMATPMTLFPSVLRNVTSALQDHGEYDSPAVGKEAFKVYFEKAKSGDQKLLVKLAAFEAVASPTLLREVKTFFSVSPVGSSVHGTKRNALLAQSLSGSVDLFYDADEGTRQRESDDIADDGNVATTDRVSELSSVLIDAWKEKTETKTSWMMDVDIKAPIVVIPEKCTDPRAHVLIFDLGHLRLQYGKITPAAKVLDWLQNNPITGNSDAILDSGSLEISDLTCMVGKANYWHRLVHKKLSEGTPEISAVVEPISVTLDFGVESRTGEDVPRVCVFGVIPTISLRMSPNQGSHIFAVVNAWTAFLDEVSDDVNLKQDQRPGTNLIQELRSPGSGRVRSLSEVLPVGPVRKTTEMAAQEEVHPVFHFVMGLQRLSVNAVTATGDVLVEAHLVSVYASVSSMSDGSSVNQLRMGWFWILDRIQGDFVRRQRLVCHSNLPESPELFAQDDKYDVLGELTRLGVFDTDFSGSTELADITLKKPAVDGMDATNSRGDDFIESVLNAKFTSLFIHWNPHAVKGMNAMIERFTSLLDERNALGQHNSLIVTPEKGSSPRRFLDEVETQKPASGRMQIWAEMESFDIYLNSARDDFPLFILAMSSAQISILSSQGTEQDLAVSLVLGDIRMRTPNLGRTRPEYRTLIGLAPGRSESLLSVKYCVGPRAIQSLDLGAVDTSNFESCADVELSPMRMVYIHSQIMALVEYITEGILGALAAQAASSVKEAAIEIAHSVAGDKLFVVKATAFDVILPQAAYSERSISVHAGTLSVYYKMLVDPGGGEARISLSDVSLKDSEDEFMQEEPIRMTVDVALPPDGVGTMEDQAMRVTLDISKAAFFLSKSQYAQILRTLENNMGDVELFVRDVPLTAEPGQLSLIEGDGKADQGELGLTAGLTHAGVAAVDKLRRLYLDVKISILALQLFDSDMFDPLIRVTAVKANIELKLIPDEEQMSCEVSLHNLVCEDRRIKALTRQYRSLIDSPGYSKLNHLFYVAYKSERNASEINLRIGAPQIVFIPDAIADVLGFLRVGEISKDAAQQTSKAKEICDSATPKTYNIVNVDANKSGEDIEATLYSGVDISLMKISVETSLCRFVFVDLGSQSTCPQDPRGTNQLAETIVVQGLFVATLSVASDVTTGEVINSEFEGHGDAMGIFTAFGNELRSPLQILDPAQFSAQGSLKKKDTGGAQIEIRAAALTPFEVVFSMHNAALLGAILSSLAESFAIDEVPESVDPKIPLNNEEAQRIKQLASALEAGSTNENPLSREVSSIDDSSIVTSTSGSAGAPRSTSIEVKLTMPETRVTFVNDLQGLDEALFRVTVLNFVAGGELVNVEGTQNAAPQPAFDFHMNTSILADYFDSSLNLWNELLTKPWEITMKGIRAPSKRITSSKRLSTTLDLESLPCCISLSEQFLVSLASANRMWSIYSLATETDADGGNTVGHGDSRLRQSMAASAARNLITSLPYAVENNSGANATFLLPGGREETRLCANRSIQYFRFDPPRGTGHGGKRLYGQDVTFEKSVTLSFEGEGKNNVIEIAHLDSILGYPRRAHPLADGRVLLTQVVKEGKTIVSRR
jgi:hypothetical protein